MGRNKKIKAQENKTKQSDESLHTYFQHRTQKNNRRSDTLSSSDKQLWLQVAKTVRPLPESDLFQKQHFEFNMQAEDALLTPSDDVEQVPTIELIQNGEMRDSSLNPKSDKTKSRRSGPISILESLLPETSRNDRTKQQYSTTASASNTHKASSLNNFDRTIYRKIERGRVSLEARIDLHGYTQDEAYYTLLYFIQQASVQGKRHVLIITGKGKSFKSQGVLQRQLPHWLATPSFRLYIAAIQKASRTHGGDGAFYVRLRRLNR